MPSSADSSSCAYRPIQNRTSELKFNSDIECCVDSNIPRNLKEHLTYSNLHPVTKHQYILEISFCNMQS